MEAQEAQAWQAIERGCFGCLMQADGDMSACFEESAFVCTAADDAAANEFLMTYLTTGSEDIGSLTAALIAGCQSGMQMGSSPAALGCLEPCGARM